jgi:hypothetical protein
MNYFIEKAIYVLGVIAVIAGFVWMLGSGIERQEIKECLKWQKEAGLYKGYYILDWQKLQCDHRGVEVKAEVLKVAK